MLFSDVNMYGDPLDDMYGDPLDSVMSNPLDPAISAPLDPAVSAPLDPAISAPIDSVSSAPLDPVDNVSFNVADAIFTGVGLLNPALAILSLPFTLARAYNYFFGEEEPQNMEPFGIDPMGQFGGIGGPPDADDTAVGANADAATAAANAAAAAVGFDVDEDDIAAEMGDPPGDGPPGDAAGDPGAAGDPAGADAGPDNPWHLGGLLGGSGPKDITAEGGEYIIRKSAVKKYGRSLFDDLNESKIGKRQLKGLLDA